MDNITMAGDTARIANKYRLTAFVTIAATLFAAAEAE
jgi:hypothetical protein